MKHLLWDCLVPFCVSGLVSLIRLDAEQCFQGYYFCAFFGLSRAVYKRVCEGIVMFT